MKATRRQRKAAEAYADWLAERSAEFGWEYTDARRQTDIAGALIECQVCGRVGGPCVHLVGDL